MGLLLSKVLSKCSHQVCKIYIHTIFLINSVGANHSFGDNGVKVLSSYLKENENLTELTYVHAHTYAVHAGMYLVGRAWVPLVNHVMSSNTLITTINIIIVKISVLFSHFAPPSPIPGSVLSVMQK